MEGLLIVFLGVLALVVMYVALRVRLDYRISRGRLEVRLFGVRLRRIALDDVDRISKYHDGWAENWSNTFRPRKRRLVLRRKSGLLREFVITPEYRYVFKRKLKKAMRGDVTDEVGD